MSSVEFMRVSDVGLSLGLNPCSSVFTVLSRVGFFDNSGGLVFVFGSLLSLLLGGNGGFLGLLFLVGSSLLSLFQFTINYG